MPADRGLITGGTDGIGVQVVLHLAGADTRLILVGRSTEKAEATIAAIHAEKPGAVVEYWPAVRLYAGSRRVMC